MNKYEKMRVGAEEGINIKNIKKLCFRLKLKIKDLDKEIWCCDLSIKLLS